MGGLDDDVALSIDKFDLRLCGFAPQDKDDGIALRADFADDLVRERLPAFALV